jgi:rSAM/selenodomain-associated transferase 2
MKLSIVIPVLNEALVIAQILRSLQPIRRRGHEVIVVDGGSDDQSLMIATPFSDKVTQSLRGRSRQMNAGAELSTGAILLFLHADTFLPNNADRLIIEGMNDRHRLWGRFDVKFSGKRPSLRVIEFLMNWRSRLSCIATGDQGIFVERDLFKKIGGFPEIDLMEDIALCKMLKKYSRPLCLRQRVITSSRRWEEKGLFRTVLLMWFLRFAYFFKTDPKRLMKLYYQSLE